MTSKYFNLSNASVCTATVLACLTLASCAPQYSAPQQVQASNPSVTYKYHTDQDLVQANQKATSFCTPYQTIPRTTSFSNDPDGSKVVVFECVQPAPQLAPLPQYNPNLTYNYRTDQELVDASRNAQTYCLNNGAQQVISTMGTNLNGTKNVTFQCSPMAVIR